MSSHKLDLDDFFYSIRQQIYVVIKLDDFPNYYQGSDIDIFCYDVDALAKQLLTTGNKYVAQGFEIEVTNKSAWQIHIDFHHDDHLELRFDLYQALPKYQQLRIKEHYIFSVIENAEPRLRTFNGLEYSIYVPANVDELVLRYAEYLEWYERRPDKIKHLDYIVASLSENPGRISFLDKLHLYTELPEAPLESDNLNRYYIVRQLTQRVKKARSVGWRRVPGIMLHKLRRSLSRT